MTSHRYGQHTTFWANVIVYGGGFLLLALLFGGCTLFTYDGVYEGYGEGVRVGEVMKFSHKGFIWKSWEGELLLNEFRFNKEGDGGNVFKFSTQDKAVAERVNSVLSKSGKVKIQYRQWFLKPIWVDSPYEVINIEAVAKD
jgi:hypothetical protein